VLPVREASCKTQANYRAIIFCGRRTFTACQLGRQDAAERVTLSGMGKSGVYGRLAETCEPQAGVADQKTLALRFSPLAMLAA
jgi:hypothetical protein